MGFKVYQQSPDLLLSCEEAERCLRPSDNTKNSEAPWECEVSAVRCRNTFTLLLDEFSVAIHNSHVVNIVLCDVMVDDKLLRSNNLRFASTMKSGLIRLINSPKHAHKYVD